jgi:hypothetical protein
MTLLWIPLLAVVDDDVDTDVANEDDFAFVAE